MSKKRSLYSFFDWQGIAVIVLASAGIILSLYLTINFYYGSEFSYCITGTDCDIVKKSAYSKIFGIPVSILGVIGYAAILTAAVTSLSKKKKWNLLFIFSSLGFSFSFYLTYLELFIIKAVCSYCIISAIIITLILILIIMKKANMSPKLSFGKSFFLFLFLFATVFTVSYSIQTADSNSASTLGESTPEQVELAMHLSKVGATMYGAYNCPHCISQKKNFGEAFKHIRYVECNQKGPNANPSLCFAMGIKLYPTWEINGKFYEGQMTLDRLSELTNFNKIEVN